MENIQIEVGDSTVSAALARPADAVATVLLAPGAGSSFDHPFLVGFASALNDAGLATLRFNFPYREAGRRMPDGAPKSINAWREVMTAAGELTPGLPLWAAGKSFGGRMASMAVAEGMPAAGLVFLGYPLHPPGKPEKTRDAHLYGIDRPMLFVQGNRDAFGTADELAPVLERLGTATAHWVSDANHSFEVRGAKRPSYEIGAALAPAVAGFISASVTSPV